MKKREQLYNKIVRNVFFLQILFEVNIFIISTSGICYHFQLVLAFFLLCYLQRFFSSSFRAKAIALSPKMHWVSLCHFYSLEIWSFLLTNGDIFNDQISNIVVGLYFLSVVTKFGIRKVYMGYVRLIRGYELDFINFYLLKHIVYFVFCLISLKFWHCSSPPMLSY